MQGPQYLLLCLLHLISALTDEEKKTIVEKHNFYRSRADPPAADMNTLRWDRTLEELATSYAAKCIWEHNEERGFIGENLFIMSGSGLDVELGLADWHKERDYYNFTADTCQEGQMCGHYTQMVWAHSERVGCGETFCEKVEGFDEPNMYLLVCNYEPPGNFQGEKPYTPGDPCSSCPSSHICRDSLCVDKGLEQVETSTAPQGTTLSELISGITRSQLGQEQTQSELDPTKSELVPKPTQSKLDSEATQSELVQETTQSELVLEPTQSEMDSDSTKSELVPKPTQSELDSEATQSDTVQETTRSEPVLEPTQSEMNTDSTKSELVPKPTQSELDSETTQSDPVQEITQSELVLEPTQSEINSDSTKSELVPKPTQSELDSVTTQSDPVQETTQSELFLEPTQSEMNPDSTKSELVPKPTQSELHSETTQSDPVQETTRSDLVLEPTQSEMDPDSTKSELVPKPTQSEPDLESTQPEVVSKAAWSEMHPRVTPSEVVPKTTSESPRISTEPLAISTSQRMENSSPDIKEQTSTQPASQVIAIPSQGYPSASVRPSVPVDATPYVDKTRIEKAFSNDEPNAPTEEEAIIPATVSMVPTKPVKTQDVSVLVDKDRKPQDTRISQDQSRRKDSVQKPPEKKQKNMILTSSKWKKQKLSSIKWDYKSGQSEQTYFGRPVQGPHFVKAPKPCPYPCLRSQSKYPQWFPLYRTNHITPLGGYEEQSQSVSNHVEKPDFKQLYRLLGYKRGVYSLYLPPAQQH